MSRGMKVIVIGLVLLFVSIIGRGVWLAVSEAATAVTPNEIAEELAIVSEATTAVTVTTPITASNPIPTLTTTPLPSPTPLPTATPLPSPIQIRVSAPLTVPSELPVSVVWEVELIQGGVTDIEIVGLWEAMLKTEPDGTTIIEQSLAMSKTVSVHPHLWRIEGVIDPNAGEGELRLRVHTDGWSREIAFPWVVGEALMTTEQQLMLAP